MKRRDELARRRARIARLQAKRPAVTIEVTYAPAPAVLDELAEILAEHLVARRERTGKVRSPDGDDPTAP